MTIKAHFELGRSSHEELVAKAKEEMGAVKDELALNAKDHSKLEGEKRKLENLREQNERAGLQVTELTAKILALDSKMAKLNRQQGVLQEKEQKCAGTVRRSFDRENLLASVLENACHCTEANIMDSVDVCLMTLPVKVTQSDNQGHPVECSIQLAPHQSRYRGHPDPRDCKTLKIKPGTQHFWKQFHPESLKWLPTTSQSKDELQQPEQENEKMRVFFDSTTKRLILPTPLKWSSTVKVQSGQWHEREKEQTLHYEDKFEDIAFCLESSLDSLIQSAGGELNLDDAYADNPVMADLRDKVVLQTDPKPKFRKTDDHIPSGQIYTRIQNDWDAFVKCPWSEKITGTLALLKYLAENGEKVRFWSGEYENQYGLRVRTRDHDWIVGEIFIEPCATAATANTPINVHELRRESAIGSLGRLFIRVEREAEDRDY